LAMREADAIVAEDVLAALQKALLRFRPRVGEIVTLVYWSHFTDPDRRPVPGFVPGYEIGSLEGPPRENWTLLRLPVGVTIPFWLRFREHEASRLIVTFASSEFETFALASVS
jgi:hypothetical protein